MDMIAAFDKFKLFLYQVFTFGSDIDFWNSNLNLNLTDTTYYVLLIGLWIACIVTCWFMLWMCFKIWKVVF